MKSGLFRFLFLVSAAIMLWQFAGISQEYDTFFLPQPEKNGGRPLMEVLNDRHSSREFSSRELSEQMLSNLLWAAFGINRPESGKRTAPSARNRQEIDICVADYSKLGDGDENQKFANAIASTGFIGQNVYLFCASEGLSTVIRGSVNRNSLRQVMKLGPDQRIILAQTVGCPKE